MILLVQIVLVALLFAATGFLFVVVRRAERSEQELVDRQGQRFESDFDALVRRLEAASTTISPNVLTQPAAQRVDEGEGRRDPRRKKRSKSGRRPRRS